MDFAELNKKSDKELQEILEKAVTELHVARFARRTKQIKQVHQFGQNRQVIARIKTVLHSRRAK